MRAGVRRGVFAAPSTGQQLDDVILFGGPDAEGWTVNASRPVSYDVRLVPGLLDTTSDVLERVAFSGSSRRRLVVIDRAVLELFGGQLARYAAQRQLRADVFPVDTGEARKDIELSRRIVCKLDEYGIDRREEPIVVIGGGVLLDVVGWVASMYRRGTPYIRIPTTLVGLIDAGIGIKTGINHNGHKNRLGAYHPPLAVLLEPAFLVSLTTRHISNGLAEIAKLGLVADSELWELLVDHAEQLVDSAVGTKGSTMTRTGREVIVRAVDGMLAQLQFNLFEDELQRLVDFGHTFSPLLEMAAMPRLLHGEAVAIDMAISCAIAAQRHILSAADLVGILTVIARLGLPLTHRACTPSLLERGLLDATRHRGGHQHLPVPVTAGTAVFLENVTGIELTRSLHHLDDIAARIDTDAITSPALPLG